MKKIESVISGNLRRLSVAALGLSLAVVQVQAGSYEWKFNSGDLSITTGNGSMTYPDTFTPTITSFGTTDGGAVPHIGGNPATYMHVPILPGSTNGYLLTFNDTVPNGGGSYVNQYTVILDLLRPTPLGSYAAILQTNPANPTGSNNDADFYLHPSGGIGIGTYSSAGTITQNTWYRVAFVANIQLGVATNLTSYVNGNQVHTRAADSVDGRWSLFSNLDAGADLLLFNEGDTSGNYTGEWYVNSVAFIDRNLSGAELLALGGPNANGILPVPEPSTVSLVVLGLLAAVGFRVRGRFAPRR